jgi:phage-related protein
MAGKTITQRIQLVGGDEIKVQFEGLGRAGELAFKRINRAANDAALSGFKSGLDTIGQTSQKASELSGRVKDLQDAIGGLTSKFPQLIQAVGRFSQRMAIAGSAAAAAGIGIATAARNVAKQAQGQSDALEKQTQAQIDANNAALNAESAQISYESSVRKLNQQLLAGTISYDQYRKSLQQLRADFEEQQRVSNELANAQDRVKEANERLQKQLKDRQAYQQLVDTFGGPLLSSLVAFGKQVEQIRQSFLNQFGPAAAKLVDVISQVVSKNATSIDRFFAQAAAKIEALLSQNGPQIQTFLENIGRAVGAVFDGLIQAAPAVVDFFNKQIVPAVTKVVGFFNGLAGAINAVFGTRLTSGSIVIVAILAQVTGSIRLLLALLKTFGASWSAVGGIIAAVGQVLNTAFGGGAVTANIIRLGSAVATSGGFFSALFSILRAGIPAFIALGTAVASTFGISFGAAVIAVGALAAAFALLLTKVDWGAFLAAANQAIQGIAATLRSWLQTAKSVASAVIDALSNAWKGITQGASNAAKGVTDAWNAIVKFFADAWNTITKAASDAMTAVGEAIKSGFDAATKTIKGWYDSVVGFFTDIINRAKAVASAISTAISGGDNGAVQENARGGHIRGRGTGTSDSILSWLSNGEFVIRAAAVKKFGVGFFQALNSLREPGCFAAGGIVHAAASAMLPPIPRFALGGPVVAGAGVAGRPFTLQIGGEEFTGMTASQDTVEKLERFAVRKQVRSAGRKPTWYR